MRKTLQSIVLASTIGLASCTPYQTHNSSVPYVPQIIQTNAPKSIESTNAPAVNPKEHKKHKSNSYEESVRLLAYAYRSTK